MQKIIEAINEAEYIALSCHLDPDGDAVGALLALGLGLKKAGKTVGMFCPSRFSRVYHFLPGYELINTSLSFDHKVYDTGIVLDCSALNRIGRLQDYFGKLPVLLNIDHHETNDRFGDAVYVDAAACSTVEIIYDLLKRLNIEIDYDMAVAIYTGIVADTGSFRFPNTNAQAFEISSEMIRIGVKPFDVSEYLFGDYRIGRLKLLNHTLDSLEISPDGKVSMMVVTKDMLRETGTGPEDSKGLISYALHIKDIEVAALIREEGPCYYHVSLRSTGHYDVTPLALRYGGGGHKSAAGFQIQTTLPKLKALLWEMSAAEGGSPGGVSLTRPTPQPELTLSAK